MCINCKSRLINIDKSSSNTAAIKVYKKRSFSKIKIRQCKYNIAEQDHRFIKWSIQNGLGFKSFESDKRTLSGIEVVNMLRKNQIIEPGILCLNHSVNWRADF
ncbi:DDE-type integrase/transposase/recombinase [Flavobacterium endoglycinae]|uniref:DDE-type integrase/transposase/recombinase n=1 Tax=Flavobacterium endoglycinae TaxID=2816357 RepID=A0ABX7QM76_9FLAO|nr:DDE-type integrase/transposase/recombinase [Flavobacterium endoglycinae]